MGKASFLRQLIVAAALAVGMAAYSAPQKGGTFTVGNGTFMLDGKPFIVKAAELHYPRIRANTGNTASGCAVRWA